MPRDLNEIAQSIDALQARAGELVAQAESAPSREEVAEAKAVLDNEVRPKLDELTREREERIREEEFKSLRTEVSTLEEAIQALRKDPPAGFSLGGKSVTDEEPETGGFYRDILLANKGRPDALQRLGVTGPEGKAMTEGTASQGGYLVQKQIERQIVETKELNNVVRALCSKLNVTTNEIEFNQITLGTTAGWVAELATKPESTALTLATVSASVFTAAGLATISNQLLQDANPAVDRLVTADLAKRLVALEETAFLVGTGTGQPLGILNTPGVQSVTNSVVDPSADGGLLDSILDAISKVQDEHGEPSAILMHPRTWTRILKDKDANGVYTIGSPADAQGNSPNYQAPRGISRGPSKTLWGVNVVLSNRIPTNLGAGTNESRVIVGDFSEALILDRQGIAIDESPHVYFTSNQTVFRAEQRVGFTAGRQPKAFCVVGGTGLAAG